MSPIQVAQILTYSGTLPFVYGALYSMGIAPLANLMLFDVQQALLIYGAIILSFLAGIHWGVALSKVEQANASLAFNLVFMSNVVALWAWLMALLPTSAISFWGLALGFGLMLLLDWRWLSLNKTQAWFWRLRWQASLIAIVSLTLAGLYVS